MENILSCISNVVIFIFLVVPGWIARRRNIITSQQIDGLSSILVNFLWPAMVIDIMSSVQVSDELIHMAIYVGLTCAVVYLLCCGIAFFYLRLRKTSKTIFGILAFSIVFGNTGFIGIPFIQEVLGKEAGFAASIVEVVNDLLIYTLGILLIQYGRNSDKKIDRKALASPGFLSVINGLAIFILDIPLPDCLGKALGYMGNATTAMAMFLVGAQLGEMKLEQILKKKYLCEITVLKMLLIPAALITLLALFFPGNSLANHVLAIMFCMPCASCQAVFARQYQLDYKSATAYVMTTTVFLVVSLPIWSVVTNMVF